MGRLSQQSKVLSFPRQLYLGEECVINLSEGGVGYHHTGEPALSQEKKKSFNFAIYHVLKIEINIGNPPQYSACRLIKDCYVPTLYDYCSTLEIFSEDSIEEHLSVNVLFLH